MTKYLLAFAFALATLQEPLPPEDYPGQREHRAPPEGWFCSHNDPHPAKACACVRLDTSQDCEGTPQEDRKCKVWCHRSACKCPIKCMPAELPAEPSPEIPSGPETSASGMHAH